MDKVKMTHPDLPDHDPIDVLPIAVEQHRSSGWVPAGESTDDGSRRLAAQTPTQQPPPLKPASTNAAQQKPGKDGSDA